MQPWWALEAYFENIKKKTSPKDLNGNCMQYMPLSYLYYAISPPPKKNKLKSDMALR